MINCSITDHLKQVSNELVIKLREFHVTLIIIRFFTTNFMEILTVVSLYLVEIFTSNALYKF